jgi:chromosome segregation ATPase
MPRHPAPWRPTRRIENSLRILRAEADYDREERTEAFKRIETAAAQLGLIAADIAQVQAQSSQLSHTMTTLLERQREVETSIEQFGLRLDRAIEVHRDLEGRIRQALVSEQDDPSMSCSNGCRSWARW